MLEVKPVANIGVGIYIYMHGPRVSKLKREKNMTQATILFRGVVGRA